MNRPKAIGTAAETAVVRFLKANGWPNAERRALRGAADAGDITGTPGVCWEVKGGDAARRASDTVVAAWMVETLREQATAGAQLAVLVMQRAGIGPTNAGRWWAVMTAYQVECILSPSGMWSAGHRFPVRMLLVDAVALLRVAGFGDPIEAVPGEVLP